MSKIDPGKWIGEYIGEILGTDLDEVSAMIRNFLHRNYAFSLEQSVYLDSQSLGNEIRYLNHSKNPNCGARMTLVNGDMKIGIFATSGIKKHGELFLDYGDNYWIHDSDGEEID